MKFKDGINRNKREQLLLFFENETVMKHLLSLLIFLIGIWQIPAAQNVAIKTNTLYWLTTTPTLGVEFFLSSKTTFEVAGAYNPRTFRDDKIAISLIHFIF